MANQKTGPVTIPGKKVSSRNALKHGATSPKLINDDEVMAYQSLVTEFNEYYRSNNPLVKMQIERISRIKVLHDRVLDLIDTSFRRSRQPDKIFARLNEQMKMSQLEKLKLSDYLDGEPLSTEETQSLQMSIIKYFKFEILELLDTHEELINFFPGFCAYINKQALLEKVTVDDYLTKKLLKAEINDPENLINLMNCLSNQKNISKDEMIEIKKNLKTTKPSQLKAGAIFCLETIRLDLLANLKAAEFDNILDDEESSMMPDLNELDKLMRYETTLNKQFSTAIGELIELTKMNTLRQA